jgi:hypothetical protein
MIVQVLEQVVVLKQESFEPGAIVGRQRLLNLRRRHRPVMLGRAHLLKARRFKRLNRTRDRSGDGGRDVEVAAGGIMGTSTTGEAVRHRLTMVRYAGGPEAS